MDKLLLQQAIDLFNKDKVLTIITLSQVMKCSTRTVQRQLKHWQALTSYNISGKYYTLPDIPKFNKHGLWIYKNIGFSKHGNLKQTIAYLVKTSSMGFSAEELSDVLRIPLHPILTRMERISIIQRKKIAGKYIYFAKEKNIYERQSSVRVQPVFETDTALSYEIAIQVLVARIKNPKMEIPNLVRKIKRQGIPVKLSQVRDFFRFHGIEKKNLDLS